MSLNIQFGRYDGVPNKIYKTITYTDQTYPGSALNKEFDLMRPTVDVHVDMATALQNNYMRLTYGVNGPAMELYYYIVNMVGVSDSMVRMELMLDPLMTYRDAIGEMEVVLSRSSRLGNVFIHDPLVPMTGYVNYEVYYSPEGTGFDMDPSKGAVVLTTAQDFYKEAP